MNLVLPDSADAAGAVRALRRAHAALVLRKIAESHRTPVVARMVERFRAAPDTQAIDALADPDVSVLAHCGEVARAAALAGFRLGFAAAPPEALARREPIRETLALALEDLNPLAMMEAHPDKQGNALSLGDRDAQAWVGALRAALDLIQRHLPALAAEMRELLRLVVPVGFDAEKHLSASYREYLGAVYVTLHPDPAVMAEALVHEYQHNKLNLASWHYPLLENGYDFLYRSPVRPDPRPLMGILLAAHAFVPVAELYRRLVDTPPAGSDGRRLTTRLGDVIAKNDEALAVLERHAKTAPLGRAILDDLATIHATHAGLPLARPAGVTHEA